MTPELAPRGGPPKEPDYRTTIDDRWQSFDAFWLLAGLALLGLGIGVFVAVHHGHRVGGVLALVGIVCLVVGFGIATRDKVQLDRRASEGSVSPRVARYRGIHSTG